MRTRTHPRRQRFARWLRRSSALTVMAVVLGTLALLAATFTAYAVANPEQAQALLAFRPTPTLFVLNPTATGTDTPTPDPRGTLPPTWTPSTTPRSMTLTPSSTPTLTSTPTRTTTPIPTFTFTPPATVAVGWYEVSVEEARLAIQMTSTWSALTLIGLDAATTLAEITQRDPVLAASIRDGLGQAVLDNLILIAFDTATAQDPYVVNLSIAYASPADGENTDAIRDLHLQLYENNEFYEVIGSDSTQVDFQPAHRIRYTTTFDAGDEETTIYHLEVISEQRRSTDPYLLITLSTSQLRRNIYEALLDRIVSTIRFTR